jgi:FAD synthetase
MTNIQNSFINADYLIYNFEETFNNEELNDDIKYLLNKIDLQIFIKKLKTSIEIVEKAFKDYSNDKICVSFNGGKDCCVVLYIFYAVIKKMNINRPNQVLLIQINDEFNEMKSFQEYLLKKFYNDFFELIILKNNTKSIKDCLVTLKQMNSTIECILMGTRRTDSVFFEKMTYFAKTDIDWPEFMRVNPIIEWNYHEIWFFIKKIGMPYCSLYDQGYTSIDCCKNTLKNNSLLLSNGISYLPAFRLEDQTKERNSRLPK